MATLAEIFSQVFTVAVSFCIACGNENRKNFKSHNLILSSLERGQAVLKTNIYENTSAWDWRWSAKLAVLVHIPPGAESVSMVNKAWMLIAFHYQLSTGSVRLKYCYIDYKTKVIHPSWLIFKAWTMNSRIRFCGCSSHLNLIHIDMLMV